MPYNEFGEYIPDDLALDEMKYELAKKGIMPLRPGGSDVPYVASEVPQTYIAKPPPPPKSTATNVPQAIADRLGLSAIPQAALGMISSFPAAVAKEAGFPKAAEAIQYTPTSKAGMDILEGAAKLPEAVTGSTMGFGPLAEYWVPKSAFGLQRRPLVTPEDVRVMGARAVETGREIRNVPEDFRAAQSGLRRESVFGGPTLGARTQGLFDEIGDVMARREMQGLPPIPGIPDVVSPQTRMYAVRQANVGQMIDPTDLPTAKYSDQPRKIKTASDALSEVLPYVESDYPHNTQHEYYNTAVRDAPSDITQAWKTFSQKKIDEMFPDAPNDSAAAEAYANRFDQKGFALSQIEMLSEFARSPEAMSAVEAIANRRDEMINEYNEAKNKPKKDIPEDQRRAHEENVEQLELQILEKNLMPELSREEFIKRITPPTKEEYMRRANAARDYIQGTFKKDIAKYIGTSQGPQMELAKRGITMAPKEELLEKLKQFQSDRGAYSGELRELEKQRAKAGFNPKGEMYPLIVQKETEIKDFQTQLNDLNRQKSELRDLHRAEMPDEPDPANNPTETGAKYRALTNPMNALIDKIEQSKKQLDNFRLANAYETISDIAYTPVFAKTFKQNIPYAEKQFFPNLEKTPDEAQMFNVKSREIGDLGIPFLAEMIVKNIMTGRIPLDEKGKPMTSIDKVIEQLTKPRLKAEAIREAGSRKGMVKLNEFAQDTLSKIPPELRFKNSSVLELTDESTEDAIRRQISFDGMVLDHCIAGCDAPHPGINPFSGERYQYSYPVDPATGKNRGDKTLASGFMKEVLKGDQRTAHLRDNLTGLPSVTINMLKNDLGKYNLAYVSGYHNKAEPEAIANYAEDIRDYLNLRSDIISGSGDSLGKWGIIDTKNSESQRKISSMMNVNPSDIPSLGLPRFALESELRKLALAQPMGDTHADMVRRRTQLNDEYNRLVRERGEDDPEVEDLGSQIADLTARLQSISREVAAPSTPNVFKRMTSQALTSELYQSNTRGPVLAMYDNIITDDTYGLRDLWEDDFDFYPARLRAFTNAIRNNENFNEALELGQDGFDAQMRERLARLETTIQDFTPQQRELLVRTLDDFAETSLFQQFDNLNPDDRNEGMNEYFADRPEAQSYLEEISRRRRGEDFVPQDRAQTAMRVPRDIADIVVPLHHPDRNNLIQRITERLNNSIRDLPQDRETLQEALDQYQRNPLDIPGSIEMELPPDNGFDSVNNARRTISNYLIQQIQNRLGNLNPITERAPAIPTPRDIAERNVPETQAFREQAINSLAEVINDEIRTFSEMTPLGLENYIESVSDNPNNLTGSISNLTNEYDQLENIAEYLVSRARSHLENRRNQNPETQEGQFLPEQVQGVITRELNELMELGLLNESGAILNRIFEGEGVFNGLTDEQRTVASDFMNSTLRQLLNDPNYRPAGGEVIPARPVAGNGPEAYRDFYTNRITGSRQAFDQIMQAERMTPGAINEAIRRTDGDARYDAEVQRFYNVDSPAGISQLNNALRQYMEGNGFDIEAPAANPIDELERRYGEAPRAPIDIVTDGLNNPIPQFARDYSAEVQNAYREVLNEINPAPTPRNLQEAMSHLSIIHDMLEGGEHDPGEFNLTTAREMTDLSNLIERHFEAFREFENLLDGLNDQPPQGRKRGGFIEQATGVRSYSDLKRDAFNKKFYDDGQTALDSELRYGTRSDQLGRSYRKYPDYSEADIIAPKRNEFLNFNQDLKRGGRAKKMNKGGKVNPVPTAARIPSEHPHTPPTRPVVNLTDPGFAEELKHQIEQRQKSSVKPSGGSGLTDAELKNRLGSRNPTYNAGGKVSIDQMRYELLRK